MSLIEVVNVLPTWVLAASVVGVTIFYSVGLQLIIRHRCGVDVLASNHEVAGFKFSVVGVAYAVLLAFVVIAVWEEYRSTEDAVRAEARRISNLHSTSYSFAKDQGNNVRNLLVAYAEGIRDGEWADMEKGISGNQFTEKSLEKLRELIRKLKPQNIEDLPSTQNAIKLLEEITNYRSERLASVSGTMTPVFWGVLLLGCLITLGYPSFFASSNLVAQNFMTTGLAAIIGLTLFLAISLNYPFSGKPQITAEPIDLTIRKMKRKNLQEFSHAKKLN